MSVTVEFDICSRPDYDIEPDELMERYGRWETHLIPKGWEITDEMINHVGVDSSYDIDLEENNTFDNCMGYGEELVYGDLDYKLWIDLSDYHFDTDYKKLPKYYLDGDEYKETTDELMLEWLGLGITDDGKKLNNLTERIVMLEGKVEDLQSNYEELQSNHDHLDDRVDSVVSDYEDCSYRLEQMDNTVDGMKMVTDKVDPEHWYNVYMEKKKEEEKTSE